MEHEAAYWANSVSDDTHKTTDNELSKPLLKQMQSNIVLPFILEIEYPSFFVYRPQQLHFPPKKVFASFPFVGIKFCTFALFAYLLIKCILSMKPL